MKYFPDLGFWGWLSLKRGMVVVLGPDAVCDRNRFHEPVPMSVWNRTPITAQFLCNYAPPDFLRSLWELASDLIAILALHGVCGLVAGLLCRGF